MFINLNKPEEFTLEAMQQLIASKNDSENRQLRVSKEGKAFISDKVGHEDIEDLAFRLETWDAESDYVGNDASLDEKWVKRIYDCLKKNWPKPTEAYIDIY